MRLILLCFLLGLFACDRRVEPFVPADQEPEPTLRPVRIPGLNSPTPSGGAMAVPGGPSIRGSLSLAEGARPPQGGVIFVIARSGSGGPPLAVKRLPLGSFPMGFEIGPGDVMLKGRPFEGPITLSARVDEDGDPMSRGPRDLAGTAPDPLEPGARDVEIVLSP